MVLKRAFLEKRISCAATDWPCFKVMSIHESQTPLTHSRDTHDPHGHRLSRGLLATMPSVQYLLVSLLLSQLQRMHVLVDLPARHELNLLGIDKIREQ
jgi:hypothetical protein